MLNISKMRVALYEPDIPQNTGNIFRLGSCLDIEIDIIGPTGYILDDKKFKRSGLDYIKYTKYKKHIDWEYFYKWSKLNKFRLILFTTKTNKSFYKFSFSKKDILIFGSESSGVPKFVHDQVDQRLTIKMKKGLRSLNVSSAVSMVVGEAKRQI